MNLILKDSRLRCTTSLDQHLRRNSINISPTISVKEFIPILQIPFKATMLDLLKRKYACSLSILEGYVNNITHTDVVSAYGTIDFFMISKWTCQPVAFALEAISIATSSLSLSFVAKVVIGPTRATGLRISNRARIEGKTESISGERKILSQDETMNPDGANEKAIAGIIAQLNAYRCENEFQRKWGYVYDSTLARDNENLSIFGSIVVSAVGLLYNSTLVKT
ncbi:hypothetical protein H5410_030035 [Solanum commersonii]|uniref:Uncharacterized protein n=1 Tax=Solanum commersonii TaxID=4109 RepID=A0A9J5YEH3_SOLCO|nr:hypothetical protein H5410_030035 [Solanum commersonii]